MYRDKVQFSRKLRRASTPQEQRLWRLLRSRRLAGVKFRRQYVIDRWIADFCCPEKWLVIELDGGGHMERCAEDRERDRAITKAGFRVLRIWNSNLDFHEAAVLEQICGELGVSPSSRPATGRPSPQREKGIRRANQFGTTPAGRPR